MFTRKRSRDKVFGFGLIWMTLCLARTAAFWYGWVQNIISIIGTDAIVIRALRSTDVDAIYDCINMGRDHINLAWATSATLESTGEFISKTIANPESEVSVIEVNGEVAGLFEFRTIDGATTIGYWLGNEFRNRGIMRVVVKHMTEGRKCFAKIYHNNDKSFVVLAYAGFKQIGIDETWIYLKKE